MVFGWRRGGLLWWGTPPAPAVTRGQRCSSAAETTGGQRTALNIVQSFNTAGAEATRGRRAQPGAAATRGQRARQIIAYFFANTS